MKNALFFSTYPIDVPLHGGQIRASSLSAALKNSGWNVECFCIYHPGDYPDAIHTKWHWHLDDATLAEIIADHGRQNINISDVYLRNERKVRELANLIHGFHPSVLILEQPWLRPLVKAASARKGLQKVPIVYSSQNVEKNLLAGLLSTSAEQTAKTIAKATAIEDDLAKTCSALVCVSAADLAEFKATTELGTHKPTLIIRNGVSPKPLRSVAVKSIAEKIQNFDYLLFVGSAHPPNATGFDVMLSPHLAYLNPNQRIVVAGGVCNLLDSTKMFRTYSGVSFARVLKLGTVSDDELAALFASAKGVILPITEGGGTNLKTAEALYSGLPVVATSKSLRGFEDFISFPNVSVADDPLAFREAMLKVLGAQHGRQDLSADAKSKLRDLTWESSLVPFEPFIDSVSNHPTRPHLQTELSDFLRFGWHYCEGEAAWTKDPESCLFFADAVIPRENVRISFSFKGFIPDGTRNSLLIYTRSRLVEEFALLQDDIRQFSFSVRPEDLYEDGSLELFLVTGRVISPFDHGIADKRLLGIYILGLPKVFIGAAAADKNNEASNPNAFLKQSMGSLAARARLVEALKFQIDTVDAFDISKQRAIQIKVSGFRRPLIRGWGFLSKSKHPLQDFDIALCGPTTVYMEDIDIIDRPDVAKAYGNMTLKSAGFSFRIPSDIPKGSYRVNVFDRTGKRTRRINTRYTFLIY